MSLKLAGILAVRWISCELGGGVGGVEVADVLVRVVTTRCISIYGQRVMRGTWQRLGCFPEGVLCLPGAKKSANSSISTK